MKYLLDTNICAYFINRTHPAVAAHIQGTRAGQIGVSAVTWAELWHGAEGGNRRESAAQKLAVFREAIDDVVAEIVIEFCPWCPSPKLNPS